MKEIFQDFINSISERFVLDVFTTEDSIRYTFFLSLIIKGGYKPAEIILEYPHNKISGKLVDTYIPPIKSRKGLLFEFKYDRAIPSKRNMPRPMKAGLLFNDILRLKNFESNNTDFYFIYITDNEMFSYLSNPRNNLDEFFNLAEGTYMDINEKFVAAHCNTFINSIKSEIQDCRIKAEISKRLPKNNYLRIYKIEWYNLNKKIFNFTGRKND